MSNEELEKSEIIVLFINKGSLARSSSIEISLTKYIQVKIILDSGSEVNLLAQSVYDKFIDSGMYIPTLPLEKVILVTASGKRSNKVKKRAMVEFGVGKDLFEVNFLISPQVVNDAILGCQFLNENGISLNFERGSLTCFRGGVLREHLFNFESWTQWPTSLPTPLQGNIPLSHQLIATFPSHSRGCVTFKTLSSYSQN
jgi:hypothetical protein